jgi:hypothetical protein
MTLEDRLRARIDVLQANMERYAERMTDWQANAECAAELDALRQAQALLHALLVVIMKPSIKAHLLRYDPMALKQAMDAIEGGGAVEPTRKPYRTHTCSCGHVWDALVRYGPTANLSGELTSWCPQCGKKPAISTPHHFNGEQA